MPELLASAQLRLHALDPERVEAAVAAAGLPPSWLRVETEIAVVESGLRELGLHGLAPAVDWLRAHLPPPVTPVVCHGDFHPFNVIADGGRVTGVIDWTFPHVKLADPAFDVGATLAILSHGTVEVPRWLRRPALWARRRLVAAYRAAYARGRELSPASLDYFVSLRLLGFLLEACAHRLAALGLRPVPDKPTAFGDAAVVREIARAFEARTGVALALPPEPDAGAARAPRAAEDDR
jgi:aminoglycoside phosphotransferase (APT) family kinase protein